MTSSIDAGSAVSAVVLARGTSIQALLTNSRALGRQVNVIDELSLCVSDRIDLLDGLAMALKGVF